MQQYKILISDLAEQDLERAGDYIAFSLFNPSAASNLLKGIRKQIDKLQYYPKAYELDEDSVLAELEIRKTYYKGYKIYFTVYEETKTVYIIRILHVLTDCKKWFY